MVCHACGRARACGQSPSARVTSPFRRLTWVVSFCSAPAQFRRLQYQYVKGGGEPLLEVLNKLFGYAIGGGRADRLAPGDGPASTSAGASAGGGGGAGGGAGGAGGGAGGAGGEGGPPASAAAASALYD